MTEAEWLACTDPTPMLEFLRGTASGRKLRPFACCCCRLHWRRFVTAGRCRAVEASERYADGEATDAERRREQVRATGLDDRRGAKKGLDGRGLEIQIGVWILTESGADAAAAVVSRLLTLQDSNRGGVRQVFHCVFGNPFRPLTADPRWLTSTAVGLASAIYAERAFDRLPILADALEEAGCDQPDLLAHCRSDGPHVRGCWAVDLILGKS